MPRDRRVLTAARSLRGVATGALSVVLAPELSAAGYPAWEIGLLLGVAMGAAAAWAILVPGRFRRVDRRGLYAAGAVAWAVGGLLLWFDPADPALVLVAVSLGGIVAGGSDISPLGALEQGSLSAASRDRDRTAAFAYYNLAGYLGTALGALIAGPVGSIAWGPAGFPPSPRDAALLLYGIVGLALIPTYASMSSARGGGSTVARPAALRPESRGPIVRLSALFAVDAVGGGMIANTLVAFFLVLRFHAGLDFVGLVLGAANVAAALSLLAAIPLARRFGLINTMVFTHLPSSVLLVLFAVAPTLGAAAALWVGRALLSQMDVPTRQSYTQAMVSRPEGEAAAGYTTAARSAQAVGSPITGAMLGAGGPWVAAPFAIAGSVKIAYDLALYRGFRRRMPPEEAAARLPSEAVVDPRR